MIDSRHLMKGSETDRMDRCLIRIEFPPAQAGIAAALRRAFKAVPGRMDLCEREFDDLLARLK